MSADEHARPIHDPSPPTTPHAEIVDGAPSRGCVACGGHHGGVGEGQRCLESTVRLLRRERADLADQVLTQAHRLADVNLAAERLAERCRRLTCELDELRAR